MAGSGNRAIMRAYLVEIGRRADELSADDMITAGPGVPADPAAAFLQGLSTGAWVLSGLLWPTLDTVARAEILGEIGHELTVEASATTSHR